MRILALETSGRSCSVALADAGQVLSVRNSASSARTTQTLVPLIRESLQSQAWDVSDIQVVAVTRGPGSFTGLRIGVTVAKTFAYASGATLVGVNTLDVIASQVAPASGTLWAVMDAQRQQLFAACYENDSNNHRNCVQPTSVVDRASFCDLLRKPATVTGPAIKAIGEELPAGTAVAEPSSWDPQPESVCRIAMRELNTVGPSDVWAMVPEYFRQSAAEEKLQGN